MFSLDMPSPEIAAREYGRAVETRKADVFLPLSMQGCMSLEILLDHKLRPRPQIGTHMAGEAFSAY